MAYDHREIEKKAQEKWVGLDLYRASEDEQKEKKYILDMFPYPSGEGLHVGHPKGYIATDIYSRHMRMRGFSVLHPMGWDAFGLPAENFALKNKVHPRIAVGGNIVHFKEQLAHLGLDYDWSREINTTDPAYYKWTQWIFLKMLEHNLAFQSNEPINWCPSCMTGLANEDLDGAVCERCGTPVVKKSLPQWVLKITDYADRMLTDLDTLNWPEHIKEAQRNWIGKSEGAEIEFPILNFQFSIEVFTTRPDTIFGATYLVLAPEHALLQNEGFRKSIMNAKEVDEYAATAIAKTEIERGATGKEKTGVRLEGISAINPATKEEIPIYVADYVLNNYGTGAIMAVPAHDERDFEFAKKFDLPIRQVIAPYFATTTGSDAVRADKPTDRRKTAYVLLKHWSEDKYLCLNWEKFGWHSGIIGGFEKGETAIEAGQREIVEETGYQHPEFVKSFGEVHSSFFAAHKDVNRYAEGFNLLFKLSDGEYRTPAEEETKNHKPVWIAGAEMRSFLNLPNFEYFWNQLEKGNECFPETGVLIDSGEFTSRESGEALGDIIAFVGGKKVTRYKLRDWVFSRQRYWGEPIPIIHCEKCGAVPVPYEDLPVVLPEVESYEPTGTGESPLAAIDEWVNTACPKCGEPAKRETNTMPQWAGSSWYHLRYMDPHNAEQLVSTKNEKYWAPVDVYVGGDHAVRHLIYARFWHKFLYDIGVVSTAEPFARLEFLGFILAEDGRKMSKRFGNIINPDDVVAEYGADAFRIYEMFMGPFENTTAWNAASIAGAARFVERVWQMQEHVVANPVLAFNVPLHEMIRKVGNDIEAFKFNTAVSQMMILLNAVEKEGSIGKEQWRMFLRVLAPFAPHVTEELWEKLGGEGSVHQQTWPVFDASLLAKSETEITVQVNGKRRGSVTLAPDVSEDVAKVEALKLPTVAAALGGKEPKRVVYVVGKIINLVV